MPRKTLFQLWLAVEFALLFVGLPLALFYGWIPLPGNGGGQSPGGSIFGALWIGGAICLIYLLVSKGFDNVRLGLHRPFLPKLAFVFKLFIPAAVLMALYVAMFEPDRFLYLPRNIPLLWLMIMVLYPIFSVYPQEIIYRAFIFHRYHAIFPSRWTMIVASSAAFGFAHIFFRVNPLLSIMLSFAGGIIFAATYARTRSLLMSSIEHALYGCFIFTIGLGHYFFTGAGRDEDDEDPAQESALVIPADPAHAAESVSLERLDSVPASGQISHIASIAASPISHITPIRQGQGPKTSTSVGAPGFPLPTYP